MFTIVIKFIKAIFKIVITLISILESVLNYYFLYVLESNNIKLHDHLNTKKKKKECTSSTIPINLSFYVYTIPKETNIIASNLN
jgi:hypothetical protein